MRQLWAAAVLLAALTAGLLFLGREVDGLVSPLVSGLSQASEAARTEDWETAERLIRQAAEAWESVSRRLLLVEAHQSVGEISALLEEAALDAQVRDAGACRAAVHRAVRALTALAEAETAALGNVF